MEKSMIGTSTGMISENRIQKLQVLFVDNNPSDHLYDLVGEIDFSNATAGEAVYRISEKQITYDAVVVDASVDSTDIKNLRKATNEKDLPLILYTSFFDQKIKEKALKLKADEYLSGSMRYSLASRIKFIQRVKRLKIQWLKQEHIFKKSEALNPWQFFQRRIAEAAISFIALILLSPLLLVLALIYEIGAMEEHVFSAAKNTSPLTKIYHWYHFGVLILFSPIFAGIRLMLLIISKEERLYSPDKNRATLLNRALVKKALGGLSHLIGLLQGDISLFEVRPLGVRRSFRITDLQEMQHAN